MRVAFQQRPQASRVFVPGWESRQSNGQPVRFSAPAADTVTFGWGWRRKRKTPRNINLTEKDMRNLAIQVHKNSRFRRFVTMMTLLLGMSTGYVLHDTITDRVTQSVNPIHSTRPDIDRLTPENIRRSAEIREELLKSLDGTAGEVFDHYTMLADYALARVVGVVAGRGAGSGFIVDKQGLIVTNAHVVDQNKTVEVVLNNGQRARGTVLGADHDKDIAVIYVNPTAYGLTELPELALANPDNIEPGERVMAVGHPLGFSWSLTTGILSSVNRVQQEGAEMVQTDAAISPGNSGGPLINMAGEVVGMNTILVTSGSNMGFSVSTQDMLETVPELVGQGIASGALPLVLETSITVTPDDSTADESDR